ncbi:MAG: hypothetical protein H8D23_37300 [Candidatus Brocadiales bacterium]|nr:hypothetical protein [Candidatus Brocadiales bacterium]
METIGAFAITLMLVIPPVNQSVDWNIGEIQTQIILTFPSGVKASYSAMQVPCHTKEIKHGWTIYRTKSMEQDVCYLADTSFPVFVRSPWMPVMTRTYNGVK